MWGGPQQQQPNYAGYGQGQGGYGQQQQRQPSPGQYGGYGGAPPPGQAYGSTPPNHGSAPPGQYGAPQGYGGAPPSQGYGGAPPPQGYGGAPPSQGYGGAPPPQGYGGAPPPQSYGGAPPPQSYGGAPPPQGYGGAPPPHRGASPQGGGYGGYAPQPPPGVNPEIWSWFQNVDADRSGKITANELQQALMNGNWSPFNPETCRLMIGMFDKDRNGTIDVHEFAALWKYIQDWKSCFDRFDTDRSGNIDANELGNAFRQFGYSLSPQFSQTVIRVFDRSKGGRSINFDDFIQSCVMLKTLTDKFRMKDTNQNGMIQVSYEEFLEMVLDTTINK